MAGNQASPGRTSYYHSGDIVSLAVHAMDEELEVYVEYIPKSSGALKPMRGPVVKMYDDAFLIIDKSDDTPKRLIFDNVFRFGIESDRFDSGAV